MSEYKEYNERHWCPNCGTLYPYETQKAKKNGKDVRICIGCLNNWGEGVIVKEDVNGIRPHLTNCHTTNRCTRPPTAS